jgi:hypothetical protein
MVSERLFEDILVKHPDLIEGKLKFIGRQVNHFGKRIDILFEDRFNEKLIIELKKGNLQRDALSQVLEYEGYILSEKDPSARVMIIANRIPLNLKKAMDHHGIEYKEITLKSLREFLITKNDVEFLDFFEASESVLNRVIDISLPESEVSNPLIRPGSFYGGIDGLVSKIKSSDNYKSFWEILPMKMKNEEEARKILINNLGEINLSHIKEIIKLVDEPYQYVKNGKLAKGPWFGRLLKSNTVYLQYESVDKIRTWFKILTDNSLSVQVKLKVLLNEPQRIKGLNVGFITLMLYLLDKKNYSIWFEGMHNGLILFYPNLDKYSGSFDQYSTFNELAQGFASEYDFDHTELDWIFSIGIQVL